VLRETSEMFEGAVKRVKSLKPYAPAKLSKANQQELSEVHVLLSDVHVGEYNDPNLTSGLTSYDFDTFLQAADTLEERLLFFKKLYGRAWRIDKLVVNFLGDLVTNENLFLGQALQVDRIITDQVFEAAHRFGCMLRNWASRFREIEVYAMPGNHGRIGKKGELHWRSNLDYMAYRVMSALVKEVKNIRWVIAEGPFIIVQHGDFNFLIHHGDSIGGGGVTRGNLVNLERKVHHFSQMADVPIHYSLTGHFHRSASIALAGGGRIIANGSFPGGSSFSVEKIGDCQVPAQKLLLFHPTMGVHSETDLILGERLTLSPDSNRMLTPNYRENEC
jgi:hypothetical protein|tara:strand:- start:1731 stop:2726 length:996 start_codon:yes stop_codon:yes gene_type:complete